MRPRLHWREAAAGDRPALETFTCTETRAKDSRGRPLPHPRPWERAVEVGIRQLKPPIGDGVLLLSEDEEGLAAVVLLYDEGRNGDTYYIKLAGVAVALRCQHQGYGAEAIEVALRTAGDRGFSAGCNYVSAVGQVHRGNRKSRGACMRAGLANLGPASIADHEEWGSELELPKENRAEEEEAALSADGDG